MAVRVIRKLRLLFDVVFTRPDASPVQDGDVVTYVQADDKFYVAAPTGGGGGGPPSGAAGGVLGGTYPNPGFAVDMATQAELDAHVNDASDAHDAAAISIADAAGDFAATDVEGALAELQADAEADDAALAAHIADASAAHAASAISYNGGAGMSATDLEAAVDELATEKANAADAVLDGDAAGGVLSGTFPNPGFAVDMATQAELDANAAASVNDGDAAGGVLAGTYPNPSFAADMATQAELDAHLNDTTDAHDASAISFSPTGSIAATDVQAAIAEVASEASGGGSALFNWMIAR